MATVQSLAAIGFDPNKAKHLGINGLDLVLGGWIPATYVNPASPFDVIPLTLTYASATTVTVPYDITGLIRMGTRCQFTQTTTKYAIVQSATYSAPNTTITFFANNDYSVAGATITDPYFSSVPFPLGFPNYFNFTPTYGAQAGSFAATPTTTTARAMVTGKTFDYWIYFDGTLQTATADWLSMTSFGGANFDGSIYLQPIGAQSGAFSDVAYPQTQNAANTIRFTRSDGADWAISTFFVFGHLRGVYA